MSVTFTTRPIILVCLASSLLSFSRTKERKKKERKEKKDRNKHRKIKRKKRKEIGPFEFQERVVRFFNESLPLFRSRNSRTPRADRNQGRHSADNVASTIACWTRKTWQASGSVGKKKKGGEKGIRPGEYSVIPCTRKRDKWYGLSRQRLIEWRCFVSNFFPSPRKIKIDH